MPLRLIAILIPAALLAAALVYSQQIHEPMKVSGFVEADDIRVGSRIGGRVKKVRYEEGSSVRPGDVLLELDPFDLVEQQLQAKSVLAEREAALAKLKNGNRPEEIAQAEQRYLQLSAHLEKLKNGPRPQEIRASESRQAQRAADYKLTLENLERGEGLRSKGAITEQDYEILTTETKVAENALKVADEELDLLKSGARAEEIQEGEAQVREAEEAWKLAKAGFRKEEIEQAAASVEAAKAALGAIERQLSEVTITSPVEGVVEAVDLRPGDLVGANTPGMTLLDLSRLWVRAYVPENRLNVVSNQPVDVTVDSFPGKKFKGRVTFVSRQAEFTPGNVQTPEERSKQVFRIKVTLDQPDEGLRPGMSADVWLEGTAKP